jgi:dipeptidyl aminopeptidase/acylaminoacyl peptidase
LVTVASADKFLTGYRGHMQRQLQRADKPMRLIKLKGEDHHLSQPATRLECLEAVVEFIDEHLGSRKT